MAFKQNPYENSSVVEDKSMQNIELHRAQSMVNDEIIIEKNVDEKTLPENADPVNFRGNAARKFCSDIQYLKVEVVMFLYMFSYIIRSVINVQLMLDKVCLVHLKRSDYECHHLSDNETLKTEIEAITNNYHLGHNLIAMGPGAIVSIFVGSWSDKYGRKVPVIVALSGIVIDGIAATICAYFYKTRVEFMFITPIFIGLSGGFIGVLTIFYSYVSDTSSPENRALKYALMEMAIGFSMPLGGLAGGWIFKFYGYIPVFLISVAGHTIGLVWIIFMVEETRGLDNKDSWMVKFRSFWSTKNVVEGFRATIKVLPNRGREQIWAIIVAMGISAFALASTSGIGYLYVFHRYNWDNTTYSTVYAIFSVLSIITMLISVPICKKIKIKEAIVAIVGTVSLLAKNVTMGLASVPHIYFLANILGLFTSLQGLASRTKMSKIASPEDLGKVFAFSTAVEAIFPFFAIAVASQGFNVTLKTTFPGMIYVIMGCLMIIPILIYIWIATLPNLNYEDLKEEECVEATPAEFEENTVHSPPKKS